MKWCYTCNAFQPNEYRFCPECGNELERNEVSSEDRDNGVFTDLTEYDSVDGTATEPITKGERE